MVPIIWQIAFSITNPLSGRNCKKIAETKAQYGRSRLSAIAIVNAMAIASTPFIAKITACFLGENKLRKTTPKIFSLFCREVYCGCHTCAELTIFR